MQTSNVMLCPKSTKLVYALAHKLCSKNKPVILCIGSDKVIADSLGPLVGNILTARYNIDTYVYGTLKSPVNALNLDFYLQHIKKMHKESPILVIDASLGLFEQVGSINLHEGGVIPACLSHLQRIGDIGITGVVLEKGFRSKLLLVQTKLGFVHEMAQNIANIVYHAYAITY